jgi:hypothetical protein
MLSSEDLVSLEDDGASVPEYMASHSNGNLLTKVTFTA